MLAAKFDKEHWTAYAKVNRLAEGSKVLETLKTELENTKDLLTRSNDMHMIGMLQGRAQVLQEIVRAFESAEGVLTKQGTLPL